MALVWLEATEVARLVVVVVVAVVAVVFVVDDGRVFGSSKLTTGSVPAAGPKQCPPIDCCCVCKNAFRKAIPSSRVATAKASAPT